MKKYNVHIESSTPDYTAGIFIVIGLASFFISIWLAIPILFLGASLFTYNKTGNIFNNQLKLYTSIYGIHLQNYQNIDLSKITLVKIHQYSDIEKQTYGLGAQTTTSRIRIYQVSLFIDNKRIVTFNHKEYKDAVQTANEINAIAKCEVIDEIKERLIQNKKAYNERLKNMKRR